MYAGCVAVLALLFTVRCACLKHDAPVSEPQAVAAQPGTPQSQAPAPALPQPQPAAKPEQGLATPASQTATTPAAPAPPPPAAEPAQGAIAPAPQTAATPAVPAPAQREPAAAPPPAAAPAPGRGTAAQQAAGKPAAPMPAQPQPAPEPPAGASIPAADAGSKAAPPVVKTPAVSPALDLTTLKEGLKETKAIGFFTKITLKNQMDDLMDRFRAYHRHEGRLTLTDLRRSYDLLVMKVLSLLQDEDQKLASEILFSREAIWGLLADPKKFATLQL